MFQFEVHENENVGEVVAGGSAMRRTNAQNQSVGQRKENTEETKRSTSSSSNNGGVGATRGGQKLKQSLGENNT